MAFTIPYVAVNVAAIFGVFDQIIGTPAAWALAAAVAAPIVGWIWAILSLMQASDEFMRALMAKRFIVSAGLAMAIASFWGFGESYANAPHLPSWLIFPLFWACMGVMTPLIRTSR
ncbi:MAG: hypothetical protein EON88_32245 [Brevundimonas sp.]|nr:MAG: hypothetical protein EON88_32245 [Brevundimonas sp.]